MGAKIACVRSLLAELNIQLPSVGVKGRLAYLLRLRGQRNPEGWSAEEYQHHQRVKKALLQNKRLKTKLPYLAPYPMTPAALSAHADGAAIHERVYRKMEPENRAVPELGDLPFLRRSHTALKALPPPGGSTVVLPASASANSIAHLQAMFGNFAASAMLTPTRDWSASNAWSHSWWGRQPWGDNEFDARSRPWQTSPASSQSWRSDRWQSPATPAASATADAIADDDAEDDDDLDADEAQLRNALVARAAATKAAAKPKAKSTAKAKAAPKNAKKAPPHPKPKAKHAAKAAPKGKPSAKPKPKAHPKPKAVMKRPAAIYCHPVHKHVKWGEDGDTGRNRNTSTCKWYGRGFNAAKRAGLGADGCIAAARRAFKKAGETYDANH